MAEIVETVELRAPPDEVWALVGDFATFADWHPAGSALTVETRGEDTVRTVTIAGGDRLVEKLESQDPEARVLSYSLVSGPFPVTSLVSTLSVAGGEDTSTLTWKMSYEPKRGETSKAREILEALAESGVQGLKQRFG
ncbi:MAG: SRPBCC family protein [Parvibaculaceae bacterium]